MKSIAAVFCVLMVFVCACGEAKEEKIGNSEWKVRMQSLLKEVLGVFPFAFDEAAFDDPKNTKTIEKAIQTLVGLSSSLKEHIERFKERSKEPIDPSYAFMAEAFGNDLASARSDFEKGMIVNRRTQMHLRSAIAKCAMCHSLSTLGPQLNLSAFKEKFLALNPPDRFTALAATRQFDEALSDLSKFLREAKGRKTEAFNVDKVDKIAKSALAIAVRVKSDPVKALALLEDIDNSGLSSKMLKHDMRDWKKSLVSWQTESPSKLNSDALLFAEARRLTKQDSKDQESSSVFEVNQTIPLLRASSHLHDLLINYPKSRFRAKSYLLLASIYDQLPGFMIWDLGEHYLGACIEENPHSSMGERCFEKYHESIVLGYTGSSGTHVPSAVRQHLTRMKELATRKPNPSNNL